MEPWQSWTIIGVLGAGGYWYYTHSQKPARGRTTKPVQVNQIQERPSSSTRNESKGKKKKEKGKVVDGGAQHSKDVIDASSTSVTTSGNEKSKKSKGKKKEPSNLGQNTAMNIEPAQGINGTSDEPEEAIDNKEFAKQMAGLKSGTSLKKADPSGETKKSKKQRRQNESRQTSSTGKAVGPIGGASSHEISTTSSTTGADADDDLSPAVSPGLDASYMENNAGGVADMLEAPAKGPSILRLIPSAEPQLERQQKPKRAAPEPETKKQRQNRQKNEEKKAAREEAEKERRVLMEKQRRIAREAEGRPAKNGLASTPPITNAWSKSGEAAAPTISSKPESSNTNGSLLDTFDESSKSFETPSASNTNGPAVDQGAWGRDVPSEEEQMKMLSELDDDGWNTVAKGGKAKSKKATAAADELKRPSGSDDNDDRNGHVNGKTQNQGKRPSTINTGSSKGRGPPSPMIGLVPPKFKTTKDQVDPNIWNRSNIQDHPEYDPEYPYALTGHPEDSDWAVV